MSQTPRHINTDRSLKRPERAADAPRHAASSTDAKQSTGGAHNEPPRRPAQGSGQGEPPRRRNKKKKTPLWLPFAVVMAIIAVISGVVVYGVSLMNKVEDSIRPDDSTPTIEEEVKTAEEYKGDVVNILVCGIDYEEGRNYSNDPTSNDGMTDMILYVQFDIKNGALRMLQIPRNSLVATQNRKITLSNGKTYAATNYQINSVALSNGGDIAALAEVIYDQYKLPIDYYVTIDMQALVEMVDKMKGKNGENIVLAYEKAFPDKKPIELLGLIMSSREKVIEAINAKAQQSAPVYLAWFGWEPPLFDGRMRSFHCLDISFWLKNTDVMLTHTGGGKRPRDLSTKMTDALLSFMRTGSPNCTSLPEWPQYTPDKGATMMLNDQCEVVYDPDREARKVLTE